MNRILRHKRFQDRAETSLIIQGDSHILIKIGDQYSLAVAEDYMQTDSEVPETHLDTYIKYIHLDGIDHAKQNNVLLSRIHNLHTYYEKLINDLNKHHENNVKRIHEDMKQLKNLNKQLLRRYNELRKR